MKNSTIIALLITILTIVSCGPRKKLVYFQTTSEQAGRGNYTPIFKKDDLLSITVSADNQEIVTPFNTTPTVNYSSTNSGYTTGNVERTGYLVDEEGNVNLPVIGKVAIAGLKRTEAVALIEEKLAAYVTKPIVNILILNFKVTVLGDVKSPGTYKIPNERLTVLEALGLAGDADITGKRKNLLIIRDNDGIKEQYRIDLTNTDSIFNSPAYYLEQNDVVYVEPNLAKRSNSSFWKASASVFISTAALIITTINTFSK